MTEEPRRHPPDYSTAVICLALEEEEWKEKEDKEDNGSGGRGRGGRNPGSPILGGIGTGRGRGLSRKDSVSISGRGRGKEEEETVGRERANSNAKVQPEMSIVDATGISMEFYLLSYRVCLVNKFGEVCNQHPDGDHIIVCMGGAGGKNLEPVSEMLANRVHARALERKISINKQQLVQEPYAVHEYYMFCNLRLILTRYGVGKCVIVARQMDIERILMLWTVVMSNLKIAIATQNVPGGESSEERKRMAAKRFVQIQSEIKLNAPK